MNRPIPVERSLVRAADRFKNEIDLLAITVRGRYGPGDVANIVQRRSGPISMIELGELIQFLVEDYETAFSLNPASASRIYGRGSGAHIDVRARAPIMHLELCELGVPRTLLVTKAGDHTLRASRDDPKGFDEAKLGLGITDDTYSGDLHFGDLTLMRDTLHEFRLEGEDLVASSLRISQ